MLIMFYALFWYFILAMWCFQLTMIICGCKAVGDASAVGISRASRTRVEAGVMRLFITLITVFVHCRAC
ncbi:hypothetical protein BDV19DRAFT_367410, partial [Aspergillus venezuelensis]